jgi:hypothetical protein
MSAAGRAPDRVAAAEPAPDEPGPDRAQRADLEAIASASTDRAPALQPGLAVARVVRSDEARVEIELAGARRVAAVDASVHPSVVDGARRRGEVVLVALDAGGAPTIVGALRTQPAPGLDAMDTIRLEARRIELVGGDEVQIRSGIAALAVRALGEVETYADRIVSRAEEVQKIIGRMLRLN